MRGNLARSLGLTLGLLSGPALAAEPAPPAVSLGRPVARAAADGGLRQTAFAEPAPAPPRPVVRAQTYDLPAPLPAGPENAAAATPARSVLGKLLSRRSDSAIPPIVASTPQSPPVTLPPPTPVPAPAPTPTPIPAWGGVPAAYGPAAGPACDLAGDCCNPFAGRPQCFWLTGEYLLWWIKDGPAPALVTTSPIGTPANLAGVIGAPGTTVLFGGETDLQYQTRSGARFNAGFWFDTERDCGLEGTLFFLGRRTASFNAGSLGIPILARPFFEVAPDPTTGAARAFERAQLVAFPNLLAGSVTVDSASRLWGADPNLRINLCGDCCRRLDLLVGFRYLALEEDLSIVENLDPTFPAGMPPLARPTGVVDSFAARNYFYGGQLGLIREWRFNRWSLALTSKVAIGGTTQIAQISGASRFTLANGMTTVQPGGLLALPSNTGRVDRTVFSVVPEVGVKLGLQVTDHLKLTVGYSFLYWGDVARPGDQIDRVVNTTQQPSAFVPGQLAGPARPVPLWRDSDFWAHGASFGMEFLW